MHISVGAHYYRKLAFIKDGLFDCFSEDISFWNQGLRSAFNDVGDALKEKTFLPIDFLKFPP